MKAGRPALQRSTDKAFDDEAQLRCWTRRPLIWPFLSLLGKWSLGVTLDVEEKLLEKAAEYAQETHVFTVFEADLTFSLWRNRINEKIFKT